MAPLIVLNKKSEKYNLTKLETRQQVFGSMNMVERQFITSLLIVATFQVNCLTGTVIKFVVPMVEFREQEMVNALTFSAIEKTRN